MIKYAFHLTCIGFQSLGYISYIFISFFLPYTGTVATVFPHRCFRSLIIVIYIYFQRLDDSGLGYKAWFVVAGGHTDFSVLWSVHILCDC